MSTSGARTTTQCTLPPPQRDPPRVYCRPARHRHCCGSCSCCSGTAIASGSRERIPESRACMQTGDGASGAALLGTGVLLDCAVPCRAVSHSMAWQPGRPAGSHEGSCRLRYAPACMHGQGCGPAPALHDSPADRPAASCSPSGLLLCPISYMQSSFSGNVNCRQVRLHRRHFFFDNSTGGRLLACCLLMLGPIFFSFFFHYICCMNPFFPYHFQSFCPNSCALLPSMQVILT